MNNQKNPYIVALQKIVDVAVGIDKYSFPMYQNAPRPNAETFAAIRLEESFSPGYDERKYSKNNLDEEVLTVTGIRLLMFDILFNRDDELVLKFDNAFFEEEVQAKCEEVGMELMHKYPTDLRNANLETDWEIRTGITVEMSVLTTQVTNMTTGFIAEVTIDGTL
jgi:hypothetical protein